MQGHHFAARHVRAPFLVSLHVATSALRNSDVDSSKCHDNSPLHALVNKNERTLRNDIMLLGKEDYRQQLAAIVSSVFVFHSHGDVHVTPLRKITGYKWKSWRMRVASRKQYHPVYIFWWGHNRRSLSTRTCSRFTCSGTFPMRERHGWYPVLLIIEKH